MKLFVLLTLAAAATGFARESEAQSAFTSQHEMLVKTIRQGRADGLMTGETADLFARQFKSDGRLLVRAVVIGQFAQAECKRMHVTYTKKEVVMNGGLQDVQMDMKLNYCIDGKPPIGPEQKQ